MIYPISQRICKVETTSDIITARAGLAPFVRFLETSQIFLLLADAFPNIKSRFRSYSLSNIFKQIFCFLMDGSSPHLSYFDTLKKNAGYAAAIENTPDQMLSSHAIKPFLKSFSLLHARVFRRLLLHHLFIWRLRMDKPKKIILTLDTMVMDNDEAQQREGVDPTYKKVKGFQPLQLIWNGKIIDAIFRRGKKHSNHGNAAINMLKQAVKIIRQKYDPDVPIVVRMDSGFMDIDIFAKLDALEVLWVASGKMYEEVKARVKALDADDWQNYDNGKQKWQYAEFSYGCESWGWEYRAVYTRALYDGRQELLDFERPDNVILTNIDPSHPVILGMEKSQREAWLEGAYLVRLHHQRGADELPHRGLKDFGFESLPFKRFAPNQALYYLMLLGFFLFESFKEDVLCEALPVVSYATTVRRKFLDIAAKIIRTGHEVILKVSQSAMEQLEFCLLWKRAIEAVPIPC